MRPVFLDTFEQIETSFFFNFEKFLLEVLVELKDALVLHGVILEDVLETGQEVLVILLDLAGYLLDMLDDWVVWIEDWKRGGFHGGFG